MSKQVSQQLLDHIRTENEKTRAWASQAEGRWASTSPEKAEFWANRDVYTLADYERWGYESSMSDLHKAAFGVRPRGIDFESMSLEDLKELYNQWAVIANQVAEEEKDLERQAVQEFEAQIAELIEMGAGSRETAIRWMLEAHDEIDEQDDGSYVCYLYGLPYSMKNEFSAALAA